MNKIMSKNPVSNIKLGVFVLGGLFFLIFLLYMIGKNQSMFGSYIELRSQFRNVQGVTAGNNVRYSGIHAGTVKRVKILSDTAIEIVMLIESSMQDYIRKNAIVSIGSDGLMGNRVLNITPGSGEADRVEEGDLLANKRTIDTDEMLQTLGGTSDDIAIVAKELKHAIQRINSSTAIWEILNDNSLPRDLRASFINTRLATAQASATANDLHLLVTDIRNGKGSLGMLLSDTQFIHNLDNAISKIKTVGDNADSLASELNLMAKNVRQDLEHGKGPANAILKDSAMVTTLNQSLENIREGTQRFTEVMEALKHNFLLRGYFRRLERKIEKGEGKEH
ncbi:MAG TPA: MlaD family protein [Chitinophagaceae bacterium]|nr:MlaD family protein [Chitinophagaceae bacterium]